MCKKVLISCATSALGQSVSKKLAETHQLLLTGRNIEKLARLNNSIKNRPHQCLSLDFFDSRSIEQCILSIDESIDGFVFIIPRIQATTEVFPSSDQWTDLYDHYFIKPLTFLKRLYERKLFNKNCKIVIVSGISSKHALQNYAMNNALRAAWLAQAKSLSIALGEDKIIVNTLSMGGVLTASYIEKLKQKAITQGTSFESLMRIETTNIPLSTYATVDNAADAIIGLLSSMSDHITGQNIVLDGGFIRTY